MKAKLFSVLSISMFLHLLLVAPGQSCVGRILTIAHDDSIDQQVMGQILAIFIQERTGTTINLVNSSNVVNSREMVKEGKADIFLSYLTSGLADMDAGEKGENNQETYSLVKQFYLQEMSMVWLKPFGYEGPIRSSAKNVQNKSLAAAVATKQCLERFPVLERVINKLDGLIDKKTLEKLKKKTGKQEIQVVVKEYLKSQKMI